MKPEKREEARRAFKEDQEIKRQIKAEEMRERKKKKDRERARARDSEKREEKLARTDKANQLIEEIASCGRKFFRVEKQYLKEGEDERVSKFELSSRGHVYFIDKWTKKKVYTHYVGNWKKFSEGGTLQTLVEKLRNYISKGQKLRGNILGPFPEWICGGDLWGYGKDMEQVRDKAVELEILDTTTIREYKEDENE